MIFINFSGRTSPDLNQEMTCSERRRDVPMKSGFSRVVIVMPGRAAGYPAAPPQILYASN